MKKMKKVLSFLLAFAMTVSCMSGMTYAAAGTKPADGLTEEQPFAAGTGGSQKFRIPCLVSLNDGTLVGACDARWNGGGDAGGIDTIVSYSKDKGATWNYTFANYLGDNGNTFNNMSTAFIDPALATDGENVYMIADLYPAGIAINTAKYAAQNGHTGYNEDHQLVLAKATDSVTASSSGEARKNAEFSYYLEENTDKESASYYLLKDANGNTVEGYVIDEYFHIKGENVDTNLFCGDSPYFPFPTDFLYLTKSEDGGKTWSAPRLLDVKKESEQTFLVGPGRGTVITSGEYKGRIIFTAYEYSWIDKNSTTIYSDDGGQTWTRGESVKNHSSEAVVAEADGRLYMFVRRENVYYISNDGGATWSDPISMGITYNATCQLTAITYSKKIDGKTAILFAGPSNTSSRAAGKIYVGLVQNDGSLKWAYQYSINGSAYYAYSCITECSDGNIGLLYENEGTSVTYKNIQIADIVPGAAVGSMWLTETDGTIVTSVEMKSNQTKELTVNGLENGADVRVESNQKDVLEAAYTNGKLTLATKQVTGLSQVVVTVRSGDETTTLKVNVTDSENYEIVNLHMGESVTYIDQTGNYADADLSKVDRNVATVTVTGEDPDTEGMKATLATGLGNFNGQNVDLDQCLYTFTKTDGDHTYVITSQDAEGQTVYLSYRSASSSGYPGSTNATTITLAKHESQDTFSLLDNTGSNGGYLYFWSTDSTKLHFDRNGKVADSCYFELYAPVENGQENSEIEGYKKVTSLEEIQDQGTYLVVTQADGAGNRYVLYPSLGTQKYHHVARITKLGETTASLAVQLATADGNFSGDLAKITDSLYTFTKGSADNTYTISAITADGTRVYLDPSVGKTPFNTNAETITLQTGTTDGTFKFRDSSHNLHFYYNNTNKLHFDRCGNSCGEGDTFEIYKLSAADSDIKGFAKVTSLTEIQNGGQYLIARKANDNQYYILHPSTSGSACDHVAKVTTQDYPEEAITGTTKILIEANKEGTTSVTIGDVTYYIIVKNDVKNITLKVGDSTVLPGVILAQDESQNIVTLEKNTELAPYEQVKNIVSGEKYLIVSSSSYLLINSPSKLNGTDNNPNGLDMTPSNFRKGSHAKYMWTITVTEGGYVIQDTDGKYLTFNGSNVSVGDVAQTVTIGQGASDGYGISYGGQYLNNWAKTNNRVAGYGANDNDWYLYQPVEGYLVTAKESGTTTIVLSGVNYNITVENENDKVDPKPEDKPAATEEDKQAAWTYLDECKEFYTEDHFQTEEEWEAYQAAMTALKELLEKENLTETELREAIAVLEEIVKDAVTEEPGEEPELPSDNNEDKDETDSAVQTGDQTTVKTVVIIMILAVAAIVSVLIIRKKRK